MPLTTENNIDQVYYWYYIMVPIEELKEKSVFEKNHYSAFHGTFWCHFNFLHIDEKDVT